MMSESKFDKKKKERRAAALVALAAEKKSGIGHCLTAEEMAALVDGNSSLQEGEQGWGHLSDCSECYEQWYVLKMEKRGIEKKSGVVHLLRPRNFAVIGSAMAVAASVVVFLNIPQAPMPVRLAEDSVQSQQVAQQMDTSHSQVMESEAVADKAVSSKAPSAMYEKVEVELKEGRPATQKMRLKTAAAPQPERKMPGTPDVQMVEMVTGKAEKAQSIERWLEMVQEGCLKKRTEGEFWSEVALKGDLLFQHIEPGADIKEEEVEAFAIFQLLPRSHEKDVIAGQCEQILIELAEQEKSR